MADAVRRRFGARLMKRRIDRKIPLRKALLLIALSILLVSGSATGAFLLYHQFYNQNRHDPRFHITAIAQKNPETKSLSNAFFAEWLGLRRGTPINLYRFNLKEGEKKLKEIPLIKEGTIKKIKPGTLFVEYRLRLPIAYIGDYSNTALDVEGVLIPFEPFFTIKNLPIFYLGIEEEPKWGDKLESPKLHLAKEIYDILRFNINAGKVKQIDVSKAFALSYGQRQVVVELEGKKKTKHLLRLNPEDYPQQLSNYLALQDYLNSHSSEGEIVIIDLRIPHLAFIDKSTQD